MSYRGRGGKKKYVRSSSEGWLSSLGTSRKDQIAVPNRKTNNRGGGGRGRKNTTGRSPQNDTKPYTDLGAKKGLEQDLSVKTTTGKRQSISNNKKKQPGRYGKNTPIMPGNLNAIKSIKNDTLVCNNVKMNVKGCFEDVIALQDIKSSPYLACGNIENFVCELIKSQGKDKTVFVSMAWIKNEKILQALIEYPKRVLMVINAEDFSRKRDSKYLAYYDRLPKFQEPFHSAFYGTKSVLRALDRDENGNKYDVCRQENVRSFGNAAFDSKSGVVSILHHKVILFFEPKRLPGGKYTEKPVSFICGSFNCTKNATKNIEMTVFIESDSGAERLFNEISLLYLHSLPLKR
jgi:hypothetical protein